MCVMVLGCATMRFKALHAVSMRRGQSMMLSAYLRKRRLVLVALPAVMVMAASFGAFDISANDAAPTIKVEINGRMLYFPVHWADWLQMGSAQPSYIPQNPRTDVTYRTTSLVQSNRATRAWNEGRLFWNTDLWPDFRVSLLEINTNHADPLKQSLTGAFPDGWWPLPSHVDPTREGVGRISCDREPSTMRFERGTYAYLGCGVSRRVADGLGIRYRWNRLEVGEQNEREQDRRVQRLVEWLLTPPDRRMARPID